MFACVIISMYIHCTIIMHIESHVCTLTLSYYIHTDGYTSAGFSGRMPMAELADAIVQVSYYTIQCMYSYV